ncbi:glycosyltransferase [Litoribacter alkaliphilus]|uniref:Glycosyltransferase n=1 Tax=Litoribacter ruber TaxID=702568 RepID=A0AAP2G5X3_9BACT|nr:glycosyltransferase [Litoribacter alkaliphilus]MBS9525038.1 glycosyltransferase [Litoribacter alkaliphilus]
MSRFLFYDDKIINLLLENEKPTGGAAVQALNWVKGLLEEGHEVALMTNVPKDKLKSEYRNLKLIPLYDDKKGMRWIRWVSYRIPFIHDQIREYNPDFLYQGVPGWQSMVLALICKKLGIKFLMRISSDAMVDDRFLRKYSKPHQIVVQNAFNLADCIICQNEYQFGQMQEKYPNNKILKITNPIEYKSTTNSYAWKGHILWLGLFKAVKNLGLLYEIASLLPNEKFVVAGEPAKSIDSKTREYIQKLEKLPNVKFVGFLQKTEVTEYLINAKFLLNTSLFEGFSNTFLEAMQVHTPILTTNKVNPDQIITKHNLGITYDSAEELKNKINNLTEEQIIAKRESIQKYLYNYHHHRHLAKKLVEALTENTKSYNKGILQTLTLGQFKPSIAK